MGKLRKWGWPWKGLSSHTGKLGGHSCPLRAHCLPGHMRLQVQSEATPEKHTHFTWTLLLLTTTGWDRGTMFLDR